jgi:subtilisin family serine protease
MLVRAVLVLASLLVALSAPARPTPVAAEPIAAGAASMTAAAAPESLVVGAWPGMGLDDSAGPIPRLAASALFGPAARSIQPLGGGAFQVTLQPGADSDAAAAALLAQPAIRYAEPDYLLSAAAAPSPFTGAPNDPAWGAQEEMRRIEVDDSWRITTGSPDVVIAFLDSGVMASHVDFAGKLLPGYDFLEDKPGAVDDNGHGTFTAALAGGLGNNKAGIAGVCWGCKILPLKILDRRGLGPVSAFAKAVRYAVEKGARIINVSASVTTASQAMRDAVNHAVEHDVLIVAAAGNEGNDRPVYPAAFDRVLAIGATDRSDRLAPISSFGFFVDLVAPGVRVTSAATTGADATTTKDGTSLSAPLVAGAAGLLLSARPDLSIDALTNLLVETSLDLGTPGRDERFGGGRLSVYDALLAATRPEPAGGALAELAADLATARLRIGAAAFQPGEPVRGWVTLTDGHYLVPRGLVADAGGRVTATLPLTCDAPAGLQRLTLVGGRSGRIAATALTLPTPPARACFQPLSLQASTAERLFFRETRHTLGGGFRTFWEEHGGLEIFGFPISEEFRELNAADGRTYTVQYFERARFEYHPEHRGTPYEVQLGLLGLLMTNGRAFPPAAVQPDTSGRRYFEATSHSLSADFLRYWEATGGLDLFGYPISEPAVENGFLTQYFERNRFELHPELPPAYRVSLGLLGTDLARRSGYLP